MFLMQYAYAVFFVSQGFFSAQFYTTYAVINEIVEF